jgi:hypothetical protein
MTMASNAGFLSTITNIDSIDENQIRQKIHCGELVLIDNNNRTFSLIWSKLRLIADSSDAGKILEGWVACRYCESIFRTHSKLKSDGTRKNYGLTTPTRHLDVCKNYQKELVTFRCSRWCTEWLLISDQAHLSILLQQETTAKQNLIKVERSRNQVCRCR